MRKLILLVMFLFLLPIVFSIDECQRQEEPRDTPCGIISTFTPGTGCDVNLSIFQENGTLIQTQSWSLLNPFCNTTWNISTSGTYIYNSTIEDGVITIKAEDNMESIAVALFIILVNIGIFSLPFWVKFNENAIWNKIISKMVFIFGLVMLILNGGIIWALAEQASLGVGNSLLVYQRLFYLGLWVAVVFLFWNMTITAFKEWKLFKQKKRMGEDG